jgi:hypothetical protein
MAGGEQLDRRHRMAPELAIVGLKSSKQDAKVNFAAFQHPQDLGADRLDQPYLHPGIELGVPVQKRRQDGFDLHR